MWGINADHLNSTSDAGESNRKAITGRIRRAEREIEYTTIQVAYVYLMIAIIMEPTLINLITTYKEAMMIGMTITLTVLILQIHFSAINGNSKDQVIQ